jgi:hypothetical protein
MRKDFIINTIIKEVGKEIFDEEGIIIDPHEIFTMVDSQFIHARDCLLQGKSVLLGNLMSFNIRNDIVPALEMTKKMKEEGYSYEDIRDAVVPMMNRIKKADGYVKSNYNKKDVGAWSSEPIIIPKKENG